MSEITSLICGSNQVAGLAQTALTQLSNSIDTFSTRSLLLLGEGSDPAEVIAFGPFCARVLLENSCAALVGRLDPFRLLYLSEFQSQAEYEHGKRARSAFSWTGDVLPQDEKNQVLWNIDYDVPKISRALFSKHLDHVYWKPAVSALLDFVANLPASSGLAEVNNFDPDNYLREASGKGSQLYSMLSKGVHWEFFSSALLFDEDTVRNAIRETCLLVAQLGLVSHFIPTAFSCLEQQLAVEQYISYRGLLP